MLTGSRAFPGGSSTYHQAAVIVEGKARPIRELNPALPNSLTSVVECMMCPERDRRMATAEEARTALLRALPESVHAERPLAVVVRRITAPKRRLTSPFLRPGEGELPVEPGVVVAADPDHVTVRNHLDNEGVPNSEIIDEPHQVIVDDEPKEPLHVVRRRLRAERRKPKP
jgi:hypothetical protein